jgi:hypothetical protein
MAECGVSEPDIARQLGRTIIATIQRAARLRRNERRVVGKGAVNGSMPNRLRKFVETLAYGKRTGRVAYVMGASRLPKAIAGAEWGEDKKFNAAEELLAEGCVQDRT